MLLLPGRALPAAPGNHPPRRGLTDMWATRLPLIPVLLALLPGSSASNSDLPAPNNVRIDSYNMRHVLRWDPVEVTNEPIPVTYNVEYEMHNEVRQLCVNFAETRCDFTDKVDSFWRGKLKVRAEQGLRHSAWIVTRDFQASRHTMMGPVRSLLLVSHSGKLKLDFSPPFSPIPNTWVMNYRLYYWEENSDERAEVDLGISTNYKLDNLQPWTKYCVQVTPSTHYIQGQTSLPVCETTTKREYSTPVLAVILICSFLIFGAFLAGVCFMYRKGCAEIKHMLHPPFTIPSHILEYLEDPPHHGYDEECQLNYNDPCDEISIVELGCFQEDNEMCVEERQQCPEKT